MDQFELDQFKKGIFELNTRRFGTVAEIMIKYHFDCMYSNDKPDDATKSKKGEKAKNFDLYSENYGNIEVKFSRVLESESSITEPSAFDIIMNSKSNSTRIVKSSEVKSFDCNIQQVKPKFFHTLFYGLFFGDEIRIYKISDVEYLEKKDNPEFSGSDSQHFGNEGEGQFHIKDSNLSFHDQFRVKNFSYEELFNLFKDIKDSVVTEVEQFLVEDINCENLNSNVIYNFLFPNKSLTKKFNKHIEKIKIFTTQYNQYRESREYGLDFLSVELERLKKQSVNRKKDILQRFADMYSGGKISVTSEELERLKEEINITDGNNIEDLYTSLKNELTRLG
ncbi:hypothetical protein [uncultured Streptococcus sp.]|uniref:hypothetical protein n=1 Tax=uncultured Streptococcus sp. TaxID=83427 RepID=UPI0028D35380|nr:hypothetical protein [uncultured Streptococcus sp.]